MTTKPNLKITLLLCLSLVLINCSEEEVQTLEGINTTEDISIFSSKKLDLSNLDLDIDFNSYYKISSQKDIYDVSDIITEELFYQRDKNDQELLGFDVIIEGDELMLSPIVGANEKNSKSLVSSPSSCPDGWTNHGVCYTVSCVRNKVAEALAPTRANKGSYKIRIIKTSTHVRVCSRKVE